MQLDNSDSLESKHPASHGSGALKLLSGARGENSQRIILKQKSEGKPNIIDDSYPITQNGRLYNHAHFEQMLLMVGHLDHL